MENIEQIIQGQTITFHYYGETRQGTFKNYREITVKTMPRTFEINVDNEQGGQIFYCDWNGDEVSYNGFSSYIMRGE